MEKDKRFIRDNSGAFQSMYTDRVSGLNFGILTQGRGKNRRNVWHIFDRHGFSKIVNTFKDAKDFLIENYKTKPAINLPLKKGMYCYSEKESGFAHLGKIGNHYYIWGKEKSTRPVAIVLGEKDDLTVAEVIATSLITAINETIGKNINPVKITELISMLKLCRDVFKKNQKSEGMDFGIEIAGIDRVLDNITYKVIE